MRKTHGNSRWSFSHRPPRKDGSRCGRWEPAEAENWLRVAADAFSAPGARPSSIMIDGLVARVLLTDIAKLLMLISMRFALVARWVLNAFLMLKKFLPVMWTDFTLPSRSTKAKIVFGLRLPGNLYFLAAGLRPMNASSASTIRHFAQRAGLDVHG